MCRHCVIKKHLITTIMRIWYHLETIGILIRVPYELIKYIITNEEKDFKRRLFTLENFWLLFVGVPCEFLIEWIKGEDQPDIIRSLAGMIFKPQTLAVGSLAVGTASP